MTNPSRIFEELERVAPIFPTPVYWLDINCVIVGGNDLCLNAIGSDAKTINEVLIGKTYYDYYPKEIADELTKMVKLVLETKQAVKTEEKITDVITGKFRYYETARAPLFSDNNEVVGTICTAIEITDKKEKEQLQIQNAVYEAEIKAQKVFKECMNGIQHLIQEAKINAISNKIGAQMEISDYDKQIVVTKREKEILYFLSMGKTPKEIASLLSIIDGKNVSSGTVSAFINKQLYPKFEVFNISQLLEKATLLKLIPFLNEELL